VSDLRSSKGSAPCLGSLRGRHGHPTGEAGIVICEQVGFAMVSIMARKGKAAAASAAAWANFGVALPGTPRRVDGKGFAFIWAGRQRWLAVARNQRSEESAKMLAGVFSGLASVAEQGDGRALIRIRGPRVRDVLAKGVTIDLHPRAFRPGDTAVTIADHLEVQIWQLDPSPTYEIAVARSFAHDFWRWLTQSAAEFGYAIETPE
jgi:heterotetrameric sarcosine oxidase gamma subunit